MRELAPGTDRYGADVTVTEEGLWRFHVEAWADPIASWHHDAAIKIPAEQDVELMLTEGALLFERAARRIPQPPGAQPPGGGPDHAARAGRADARPGADARGSGSRGPPIPTSPPSWPGGRCASS